MLQLQGASGSLTSADPPGDGNVVALYPLARVSCMCARGRFSEVALFFARSYAYAVRWCTCAHGALLRRAPVRW